MYVRGLLLDGERKNIEPMATRPGESEQGPQVALVTAAFIFLRQEQAPGLARCVHA